MKEDLIKEAVDLYSSIWPEWDNDKHDRIRAIWQELRQPHNHFFGNHCIGDEVGAGWWPILLETFDCIDDAVKEVPGAIFQIKQIKEKFGGLRIYCRTIVQDEVEADHWIESEVGAALRRKISEIIDDAGRKADRVCEVCGEPGEIRNNRWMKTLCDTHDAIQKQKFKE